MSGEKKLGGKLFSGGGTLAFVLGLLGVGVALYRLAFGLRASTNLNDGYPWGLWISFDVMVGVALAAGGFTTTLGAYVLGWKKYKPVVRPAILTAFLGYALVAAGVFLDIGKPWSLWHPILMWQPHSMLFEVAMCVMMYLTVLFLEFSPNLFEGLGMPGAAAFMRNPIVLWPLVIIGIILSFGHQNSIGGLFLLMPHKLSHLWWSPLMNYWFYLSAFAVGLAMVSFETIVSHRSFKMEQPMAILDGLARGTAIALAVYLGARFADLAARGNLGLIASSGKASALFAIEVFGLGVLPMLLLFSPGVRKSVDGILWSQVLVIAGVIMNRFNVSFLMQSGARTSYFPAWTEFVMSIGLVSLGVFIYRWAVITLPIMSHEEAH
ncbi:MAG TPA: Ni/Fe-hydrogenase cytochrome b subunit [bacterium]